MGTKKIYIIFVISFILPCSCSRDIYIYKTPQKGTYAKVKYSFNVIPIDPYDSIAVKAKSLVDTVIITDIRKEKGIYVIIVKSNSSWMLYDSLRHDYYNYSPSYLVISPKTKSMIGYSKIKKGQHYKLILNPYFEPKPVFPIIIGDSRVYLVSIFVKGMWIPIRKSALDIYTTPNLEGLYYIEP